MGSDVEDVHRDRENKRRGGKLQNLEEVALLWEKIFLKSEGKNGGAVRNKKRSNGKDNTYDEDVVSESLKKHAVEHVSNMSSQEDLLASRQLRNINGSAERGGNYNDALS